MSSFTEPLVVRVEQGERNGLGLVTLVQTFRFWREKDGRTFTVPDGFVTDFASIPWFARGLIAPLGKHAKAAVLHDYLLEETELPYGEVNAIFNEALRVLRVSWLRRTVMMLAVRLNFLFKRR